MRHLTFSILAVLLIVPGIASARMPVVNVSSGGVSARSAFGEDVSASVSGGTLPSVASPSVSTRTRSVVSRPVTASVAPARTVDRGEQFVASNDVLVPRRPSNDLWAKSDGALRMPSPSEFSVIRSDGVLPEESLDNAYVASVSARPAAPVASISESVSELDNQIARLIELQKHANDNARSVSPRVAPVAPAMPAAPVVAAVEPAVPAVVDLPASPRVADSDVSLRRLVVPMSDDVVVRSVEKNISPRIAAVRDDMTKMSPAELRRAFRKTFLSENKHLSTYSIDDGFDVASDMSASIEGFTARRDLSETGGIRPLEIKIKFRNEDSALSRENYNLLTEYAGIVVSKPTRAIQVAIPQVMTTNKDARKLAARRLAIVEQVLTDNGVSQQRIVPVLSSRDEQGFVLRIISGDQYETLTQQQRDIFGDTINKKTYKSMSW